MHRRTYRTAHGTWRRRLSLELLEDRCLLAAAPSVGLIDVDIFANPPDSAHAGALFPSISADGSYVAFESGSFEGTTLPAPSDLVKGLTVQNDAPNVYVRDRLTNKTQCVSVNTSGKTTGNDDSRYPVISANGDYVVFLSNATDLVPKDNDTNNPDHKQNVFVRDLLTNTTTLVTVNDQGTGPANDPSTQQFGTAENIGISADGRYVIFDSQATDLVPNVANLNDYPNVYVRDLQTNTTILVTRNAAGTDSGNGSSDNPVISADGSTIAYTSLANNLDPNYTNPMPFSNYQVYVSTLSNDTVTSTKLVSIDPTGTTVGNDTSVFPSLSANGQMIAFQSDSTNLVNIPNGGSFNDVYARNLTTNTTQLVSINATGAASGDSSSFDPNISADGNHVLFSSLANDLTTNDHDGTDFASKDVFERNLATSTTQLVSINATGTNSGNDTSDMPNQTLVNASQQSTGTISSDGRYVIFESLATDLVPNFVQQNGGAPYGYDIYLRDTVAGTTTLLSHDISAAASGGNGISAAATMTPDGSYVAFQSTSSNLVARDTNGGINQTNVFVATIIPAGPTVTVTGVSPASGLATGGTTVKITGSGFTGATLVDFGSTKATKFKVNSATLITATSPKGVVGVVDITVTTPSGASLTTPADQFTYVAAPIITAAISPNSGPATGGTPVTINGANLGTAATATVKFGKVAATIISDNGATIVVDSPAGKAGSVYVTVKTAVGTSKTSAEDKFTYVATKGPIAAAANDLTLLAWANPSDGSATLQRKMAANLLASLST